MAYHYTGPQGPSQSPVSGRQPSTPRAIEMYQQHPGRARNVPAPPPGVFHHYPPPRRRPASPPNVYNHTYLNQAQQLYEQPRSRLNYDTTYLPQGRQLYDQPSSTHIYNDAYPYQAQQLHDQPRSIHGHHRMLNTLYHNDDDRQSANFEPIPRATAPLDRRPAYIIERERAEVEEAYRIREAMGRQQDHTRQSVSLEPTIRASPPLSLAQTEMALHRQARLERAYRARQNLSHQHNQIRESASLEPQARQATTPLDLSPADETQREYGGRGARQDHPQSRRPVGQIETGVEVNEGRRGKKKGGGRRGARRRGRVRTQDRDDRSDCQSNPQDETFPQASSTAVQLALPFRQQPFPVARRNVRQGKEKKPQSMTIELSPSSCSKSSSERSISQSRPDEQLLSSAEPVDSTETRSRRGERPSTSEDDTSSPDHQYTTGEANKRERHSRKFTETQMSSQGRRVEESSSHVRSRRSSRSSSSTKQEASTSPQLKRERYLTNKFQSFQLAPKTIEDLQEAQVDMSLERWQEYLLQLMKNIQANAEKLKDKAVRETIRNFAKRTQQTKSFKETFPEIMADHQGQHVFVHLETQANSLFKDITSLWEIYFQKLNALTEDHISRISNIANEDMLKFQQHLLESRFKTAKATLEVDTAARFDIYHTVVYDCRSSLLQREMDISKASPNSTKWKSGWQESAALDWQKFVALAPMSAKMHETLTKYPAVIQQDWDDIA